MQSLDMNELRDLRLLWPLQDIAELARCLNHNNTIEDAARMLCRDEDEVRQKAYDLGLIEQHERSKQA
jgi:hypothetical protein